MTGLEAVVVIVLGLALVVASVIADARRHADDDDLAGITLDEAVAVVLDTVVTADDQHVRTLRITRVNGSTGEYVLTATVGRPGSLAGTLVRPLTVYVPDDIDTPVGVPLAANAGRSMKETFRTLADELPPVVPLRPGSWVSVDDGDVPTADAAAGLAGVGLGARVRARDEDCCRYCGVQVSFTGVPRGAPRRGTFRHVNPGSNAASDFVVTCNQCRDIDPPPPLLPPPSVDRVAQDAVAVAQAVDAPELDNLTDGRLADPSIDDGEVEVDGGRFALGDDGDRDADTEGQDDASPVVVDDTHGVARVASQRLGVERREGGEDVVVDDVLGAGVEEGSHEASPSVRTTPAVTGSVDGAAALDTPPADDPTVGDNTDITGGPSAARVSVDGPDEGVSPAPSSGTDDVPSSWLVVKSCSCGPCCAIREATGRAPGDAR